MSYKPYDDSSCEESSECLIEPAPRRYVDRPLRSLPDFRAQVSLLASDVSGIARFTVDNQLLNPWGSMVVKDTLWVVNSGTNSITSYAAAGNVGKPVGNVIRTTAKYPTAICVNPTNCFTVTSNRTSCPASIIGVTLEGAIFAVSPELDSKSAMVRVQPPVASPNQVSVFTSLAIVNHPRGALLYITDFRQGVIWVYNSSFDPVRSFGSDDPSLLGYAPYSITVCGRYGYVGFAQQDDQALNPVFKTGVIRVFELGEDREVPIRNLTHSSQFNIPSCMAVYKNSMLVVANYGSGHIMVVDLASGSVLGTFKDECGNDICLTFVRSIVPCGNRIFFVSAINGGQDGLMGMLTLV